MGSSNKNHTRTGLRLLPYVMWLLPLLVINLGFRFLANIELYWQEREQSETAQQELEALTRSSTFEYQLARHAGRFSDLLETAIKTSTSDAQLKERIEQLTRSVFNQRFPAFKLHLFKKKTSASPAEMFFAITDKVESRRGMAIIYDYLLDQHLGRAFSAETVKQKDKIAESYFGQTSRSQVFATSQKGRTSYTLHNDMPHWFIWDFKDLDQLGSWGYFITTKIQDSTRTLARQLALEECRTRGNGLAGFVSLVNRHAPDVLFSQLKQSRIFRNWRRTAMKPIRENLESWLIHGPPAPSQLGNFRIYSHLGKDSDFLSVFLAPTPVSRPTPTWLWLLNMVSTALILLFAIRGLLLNRWVETGLTLRFLILYFLAASFPLGLLTVTAIAYQYQSDRSSQNQIAANIEGCLKQFETSKLQIQDTYQSISRRLFTDPELVKLIKCHGINSTPVKNRILASFKLREDELPLLGFFLLDITGKGLEFFGEANPSRLIDIVNIFREPIIQNLREIHAAANPGIPMPDYQTSEIEKLGAAALKSVSGNDMFYEIEKLRNTSIVQKYGNGTASLIHNFIRLDARRHVALLLAWDGSGLFEKSISTTIGSFKTSWPDFSFIAFRNTPQGIRTFFREKGGLADACFLSAARAAEIAAARGSIVKEHEQNFSIVAMPFGQHSEIVIVGVSSHDKIAAEKQTRLLTFFLLITGSLIIAILSAYLTAAFLLKPVTELKTALNRVSDGDYSTRLTSERKDELGNLTREFARMVEGIKERQRLAALLSDHAIEALSTSVDARAPGNDAREFKGIALVSDIRNFTTLCETCPTQDIIDMLNDHFAVMAAVIAANGGRIYKFIGDAIEAVFDETDASATAGNALKTAIEMQCAQRELNKTRAAAGKFTCSSGVGLARGTFFAGSVGSEETRLDYSIIGDTFSRAAQLEALTKKCLHLPIAFDAEIAEMVSDRIPVAAITSETSGMTLADENDWTRALADNFSLKPRGQQQDSLTVESNQQSNSAGFFQKNFRSAAMAIFALFAFATAFGIHQGFAIRNESFRSFYRNRVHEQNLRLVKQIKTAAAAKIAFEMKMRKVIKGIERELNYDDPSRDSEVITRHISAATAEMRGIGLDPTRVFVLVPGSAQSPVAYSSGVPDNQRDFFQNLAQYQHNNLCDIENPDPAEFLNPRMKEAFGSRLDASYISNEKYGASMMVKNGPTPEFFYWNHITLTSPDLVAKGLPANNYELINCEVEHQRFPAIIMFAIPEEQALKSPELLVRGYMEPEIALAFNSPSGKIVKSPGFPADLTSKDLIVTRDETQINNEPYRFVLAQTVPMNSQTNLLLVKLILAVIIILLSAYFYRSLYLITALTASIQVKLAVSILLTAIIPVLTVAFVSDYFLTGNFRATVQQQKIEIQRFLDNFELRQSYIEPIVTRKIQEFSTSPAILNLVRRLDQQPDSIETRQELEKLCAAFFSVLDADDDWSSNLITREAIFIGLKNWVFFNSRSKNEGAGFFADILTHMGKHILAKLNHQEPGDNLSMKDLKGELYYESALHSLKSNFGDEAYIKITNALNQLVAIEITTGAAGLLITPIPSIETPEYMLLWMLSFSRGGYLSRISTHNRGPFAVMSVENNKYSKLVDRFMPVFDLDLGKAAAWVSSSNLPFSFEVEVGAEKVSIESRPGIQQIDNFLVGAASQTPIELETATMRTRFIQFLLLALLVFIFIGHQTASDIVIPVRALTEGMHQVGLQNYFYRIATDRRDELGELCASYDRFARGLAEKEIMGRMVSKSAQKAASKASDDDNTLSSGKRDFVFLFVGSPDFSAHLKTATSEMLFKSLKEQVALICRIIIEEGGDIDKMMGDKILGVFAINPDKPAHAFSAALEATNKILQAEHDKMLQFPVAIGVNAGEVISGMLGFGTKRDFTVIGDAVNVTARIQKEAEKLITRRCLYSEEFINMSGIPDQFRLHSEAALKGKSNSSRLYEHR